MKRKKESLMESVSLHANSLGAHRLVNEGPAML